MMAFRPESRRALRRKPGPWTLSWLVLLLGASVVWTTGCGGSHAVADLGSIYDRSAQWHGPERNPVILIPGILGSKLIDSAGGTVVWGAFSGGYADPGEAEGARLIALPMAEGSTLAELKDGVRPGGVLENLRVKFLGLPFAVDAYVNILTTLGIGGYVDAALAEAYPVDYGDDHFTCFQFDYDWRRDNVENARRLHRFIQEKRTYVQGELERRFGMSDVDVKFDIVAHSMGGLVAHYYLRYGDQPLPDDGSDPIVTWAGARNVEKVVMIAPPNLGSVEALVQLTEGKKFGLLQPRYEPALLGTMPSLYQLLPRSRHRTVTTMDSEAVDLLDPALWVANGWGLADPDQDPVLAELLPQEAGAETRGRIARDHLGKCLDRAARFQRALDSPAPAPDNLEFCLFAGDAEPTAARVVVDPATGKVTVTGRAPGDGTVLRTSVLADERPANAWSPHLVSPIDWHSVVFLFTDHLGLTRDPEFTDNLLYLLLEAPRKTTAAGDATIDGGGRPGKY